MNVILYFPGFPPQSSPSHIKIGDKVRVKPSVTTPKYKWGSVTHRSVGVVKGNTIVYTGLNKCFTLKLTACPHVQNLCFSVFVELYFYVNCFAIYLKPVAQGFLFRYKWKLLLLGLIILCKYVKFLSSFQCQWERCDSGLSSAVTLDWAAIRDGTCS